MIKKFIYSFETEDVNTVLKSLEGVLLFPPYSSSKFKKEDRPFAFPKGYKFECIYLNFIKTKGTYLRIFKNKDLDGKVFYENSDEENWILEIVIRDDFDLDQESVAVEFSNYLSGINCNFQKIKEIYYDPEGYKK